MSKYPWTSETREAAADRRHRFANDLWAYHNPAKRVPRSHELLFSAEQKAEIARRDEIFHEGVKHHGFLGWLGLA